jgi:hypothetical protein
MSDKPQQKPNQREPKVYQIKIKGHLGSQWSDWFDSLTVTQDKKGNTLLTGPVIDDAALHGLLKKVRDLGMPLISFNPFETGQDDPDDIEKEKDNSQLSEDPKRNDQDGNV